MSTTTYLSITHILENQDQKEVTANEAFDILDGAIAGILTEDLAGDSGDITLDSATAKKSLLIKCTGALSASVNLIVPSINHGWFFWHAGTDFDVTLKTSGGTGVTLSPGEAQIVYCDATNVIGISTAGSVGSGSTSLVEKTVEFLTGSGGTSNVSLATNVDQNTVEVYVDGIRLRRGSGRDYQVTESVPASGNYDQLTPEYSDAFPTGANLEVLYYV